MSGSETSGRRKLIGALILGPFGIRAERYTRTVGASMHHHCDRSPEVRHGMEPADELAEVPEAAAPLDGAPDDLLQELARAMHKAALARHRRMIADVAQLRSSQSEAIKARASGETDQLRLASESDIQQIDAWAQTATELIAAERVRRIDARRERLQAELARQGIIAERELMAVDVTLEDHEVALEAFFKRLETETDPTSIASLASAVPPLPSLSEVAEAARRHAMDEFAPIDDALVDPTVIEATATAAAVSPSPGVAVMDPDATRGVPTLAATGWPDPGAVAVPAGSGTLLRTMPSARPLDRLLGRNRGSGEDPVRKDRLAP